MQVLSLFWTMNTMSINNCTAQRNAILVLVLILSLERHKFMHLLSFFL